MRLTPQQLQTTPLQLLVTMVRVLASYNPQNPVK